MTKALFHICSYTYLCCQNIDTLKKKTPCVNPVDFISNVEVEKKINNKNKTPNKQTKNTPKQNMK